MLLISQPVEPNVVQVITDKGETYVFVWESKYKAEMLRELGRMAVNPAVSFQWVDAARAANKIRRADNNASCGKVDSGR